MGNAPLTLANLTGRLMASYVRAGGINHVDGKNLPSKHAVAEIAADLLRLLFPGFFDERPIHSSELEAVTGARLDSVRSRLEEEIRKTCDPCRFRLAGVECFVW
jgi:serine O-acetyltransferase